MHFEMYFKMHKIIFPRKPEKILGFASKFRYPKHRYFYMALSRPMLHNCVKDVILDSNMNVLMCLTFVAILGKQ